MLAKTHEQTKISHAAGSLLRSLTCPQLDKKSSSIITYYYVFSLISIVSQTNPVPALPLCNSNIHFNIIFLTIPTLSKMSPSFRLPHQNLVHFLFSPKDATYPAHQKLFGEVYKSWTLSLCNILASYYFLQFWSTGSSQQFVMEQRQSVFYQLFKAYRSCDAPPVYHSTTVRSAYTVFMCFVFISEQTATCVTYSINWLVFITEMKSVYSAVRTGSLNKAACVSSLKG